MDLRHTVQELLARAEPAARRATAAVRTLFAFEHAHATPPKAKTLTTEQGRPSLGGVLTAHRTSQADRLKPELLAALLRRADENDAEAYLTLAEEMEEREGHYRSVLGTRKLAVSGAPVLVEAASDSAHNKAITEDVEKTIVQSADFEGLVTDLMDGVAKGFACVEIPWAQDAKRWEPRGEYKHRPARHFVFDQDTMETPFLRSLTKPEGEPLTPYRWLVHRPKLMSGVPLRAGLARPIAWIYAFKHFSMVDWAAFLDVYGMPIRIGKFPASMESKKKDLLKALRQIGSDAAGVIPEEMQIQLLEASKSGQGNSTVFEQAARYLDSLTSKVVLGQTMTSDDGSSLAQAEIHQRTRFDIRNADQRAVSATINRDLVRPFILFNYGPQGVYPKVIVRTVEKEDTKALAETTRIFVNLGGKVQMSEVRDGLGYAEPEDGAELLEPEAAIQAKHKPAPAPAAPGQPGRSGAQPAGGKSEENGGQRGDEPAKQDSGGAQPPEENQRGQRRGSASFARVQGTTDVVDELVDEHLDDWRPLLEENVGALVARAQAAETYEDARAALDQLAEDAGEELALGLITANLARATFKVRGVGDATDRAEDV